MLEGVTSIVQGRLKPLFPPANYGWAGGMKEARVDKWHDVMISFPADAPAYSCHSASLTAVKTLREAEFPALLAKLALLFKGGDRFTHYLAVIPERASYILVGLTPLDRLIGLALPQRMSDQEFDLFSKKFSRRFLEFSESGNRSIALSPKYSFPLRIREEQLTIYSRFCGYQFGQGYNLELCASLIGFDQESRRLTNENALTFTYYISREEKVIDPVGCLTDDIRRDPSNWELPDGFSPDDLKSGNPIIRAIVEDWRDLAPLAAKMRAI